VSTDEDIPPFDRASRRLRTLGLTLRALPGEYIINLCGGGDKTARTAADLTEAISIGEAMAEAASLVPEPRKGHRQPLSSARRSRRRFVRRHNKWFRRRSIRSDNRD
jgi:hypothetical protein